MVGNANREALFGNRYVNVQNGRLKLDKLDVLTLTSQLETPVFIFLENKIRDNLMQIQQCFEQVFQNSQGFYSLKSNYLPPVVDIIMEANFGVEIITQPEFNLLEEKHFKSDKIIAGGPYLTDNFLSKLVSSRVPIIILYDIDDIPRLSKAITQVKGGNQDILLKIQRPHFTGRQGIELNDKNLEELKRLLTAHPEIHYKGLLSHFGSQLNSVKEYHENAQFLVISAKKIKEKLGISTQIFDIGGGFPNADSVKNNQLKEYLQTMKNEINASGCLDFTIIYEPGRYIVGDTGFCLARTLKYYPEQKAIFLDVGNTFIPKFMKSSLRFYNVSKIQENPNMPVDFFGNFPSDQDILMKNYNFTPSISKGDYVLIANVGAYALTFSTRFPLPIPTIIFVSGDNFKVCLSTEEKRDITLH